MQTISQRELRNDNARIVTRVEAGESFVVTRRGTPVADLVPHGTRPRVDLVFTSAIDVEAAFDDHGGPDLGAWLRDARDADELAADDDHDPWGAGG